MGQTTGTDITIRRATPDDRDVILKVAGTALGWEEGRPHEAFFRWKHIDNPFGRSPMWLAIDEKTGEAAGFRTFMRWRWRRPDGSTARAVRAVDTATLPAYQGQGIFTRLTTNALDDLRDDGVDFVFNTPNDRSRPGYLKMGWQEVGRVPIAVRPTSLAALARIARSRVPADKWSRPTGAGDPAADVLADPGLDDLLERLPPADGYRTDHDRQTLMWRYGFGPLHYRAITLGDSVRDGVAIFRLRDRGDATEVTVTDVLAPTDVPRARRRLLAAVRRAAGGDYLIQVRPAADALSDGFLPLPGQGPILTWREVREPTKPPLSDWDLRLGDIELF